MNATLSIAREERALATPASQTNKALNSHMVYEKENRQAVTIHLLSGQIFRESTYPVDMAIIMIKGQITISTPDYEYSLRPKEIITIPSHTAFSLQADKNCKLLLMK